LIMILKINIFTPRKSETLTGLARYPARFNVN